MTDHIGTARYNGPCLSELIDQLVLLPLATNHRAAFIYAKQLRKWKLSSYWLLWATTVAHCTLCKNES